MGKRFFLDSDGYFVEMLQEIKRIHALNFDNIIERYAKKGVEILSMETPFYTGLASYSWRYEITHPSIDTTTIEWHNDDIENGYNVIILIQYGHGVKGGGYVQGRDFINPLIQPIFDGMVADLWREVCG